MPLGSTYLGQSYLGEGYAQYAAPATATLSATVTISASGSLTNIPASGSLLASATEGFSPETIGGVPGNLAASVSLAGTGTVIVYGSGTLVVSVTCAISSGSVTIYVPTHNPGFQYVRDIPSYGLPDGHRVYQAVGVPSANLGNIGDYYRRLDGAAGALMYYRGASSWTAIN